MSEDRDNKKQEICPCLTVNVMREILPNFVGKGCFSARMAV